MKRIYSFSRRLACLYLLCAVHAGAGAQIPLPSDRTDSWFVFEPVDMKPGSVTDMQSWLHRPAGGRGWVKARGDQYVFEDGSPAKFWGVNICSDKPYVNRDESSAWADFMARYGINAVRFHKFTEHAMDAHVSTRLQEEKWKNLDAFHAALRTRGIYYGWSPIYGHKLKPGDSSRVLAYREIMDTKFPWAHLNSTTASLVNFAPDLQEIQIELLVHMLNHRNPETGLRYAEDPALLFVEIQNEDNIYWGAIDETLKQTPTYKRFLEGRFARWLKYRYGTEARWREAWSNQGIHAGDSWQEERVDPQPGHGFYSWHSEQAFQQQRALPTHVADRASFLFEEQDRYYHRAVEAIRATGYQGSIIGSCWQAGSGISHSYNLYADYLAGPIDRHNYFGGGQGHQLKPGPFSNRSHLEQAGSGLLSTGFQQVDDRPFQISEWMQLIPTEWVAEAAPLIAAYGMGLQGWDASYSFAMDHKNFTPTIQSGHGIYNVTSPTHLALYPALSSLIYRQDLKEGPLFANRQIDISALAKGVQTNFEKISQQYDVKSLEAKVPVSSLVRGKVTLSFQKNDSLAFNLSDTSRWGQSAVVPSNTGQLSWYQGRQQGFTIRSAGTLGLVGFLPGVSVTQDGWSMQTDNAFAVVILSTPSANENLSGGNRFLLTAVARARNSGMKFSDDKPELLELGSAPILLEPVRIRLQCPKGSRWKIHVLDHAGNRTGKSLWARNGNITLDSRVHRTLYYELERIR